MLRRLVREEIVPRPEVRERLLSAILLGGNVLVRRGQRDGANVLMLEPIGSSRRLNPSPDPSWGLHLADANIALGDLVAVVQRQIASLPGPGAAPAPAQGSQPRPKKRRPALRIRCGKRPRVVGRARENVKRVRITRRGRRGRRVKAVVPLRDGDRLVLRRRCPKIARR